MKEHKFTQHIGLKIIALLFSFLLWLFVVNIDNPKMSKVFDDVQVTMENDEIVLKETLIFEVPGFDEYSENLIKSSTIEARKIDFGKESIAETREIPYNNAV